MPEIYFSAILIVRCGVDEVGTMLVVLAALIY
jgi:hypothetical protein